MLGQQRASCPYCASILEPDIRFCRACGNPVATPSSSNQSFRTVPAAASAPLPVPQVAADQPVAAGPGVRCAASLLDLAAMMSPAMPLSIAGAVLGVAEVIYVVVPIAFVAVWLWMQIWQGLTGMTFGKSMLGLRLIRSIDQRAPGVGATLLRTLVFLGTLGLAGLPVALSTGHSTGLHDRISGLTVLDVTLGTNPLGRRQLKTIRHSPDRTLRRVSSPVPVPAPKGR